MAQETSEHDLYIALSQAFPDGLERILVDFQSLLPPERVLVWQTPQPVAELDRGNHWRRQSAELIREQFFRQLRPDVLHVSSLFEGRIDNALTSVKRFANDMPTSATLYDLIPYIDQKRHLFGQDMALWYMRKLGYLRECDLLLAISEHTRKEAIDALGIDPGRIVNICADVDQRFQKLEISHFDHKLLMERHGISRDFLMTIGAMDFHKNISGLIEAYALLPGDVRKTHQLAIVCKLTDEYRQRLLHQCRRLGLLKNEVVLTGFVSDDDLVALYNSCKLFVLPSLHEGFGLPALEAMRCGAPVIGSNRASIPEIIGLPAALFDPASPDDVSEKLYQALIDAHFRAHLREHGQKQARKFSWQITAKRTLDAFEALHERTRREDSTFVLTAAKPRLAFVCPVAPEHSEAADFSAKLLPELTAYYRIELITDAEEVSDPWLATNFRRRSVIDFERDAQRYDRILYYFRKSILDEHLFVLLERFPGTVVLHDFFLGSALCHLQEAAGDWTFYRALYRSHGYAALRQCYKSDKLTRSEYPCNLDVLRNAQGVIVHSRRALELSAEWYSDTFDASHIKVVSQNALPSVNARRYAEAIERFAVNHPVALRHRVAKAIAEEQASVPATNGDLVQAALAISENSPRIGQRRLLVDISTLVRVDSKSGIQRVVRSLLDELIARAPAGFRVEPVYRSASGYRYARQFIMKFLNIVMTMEDAPVEVNRGDIFLGLDLDAEMDRAACSWLRHHRRRGLRIYYVIYDLLPVLHPRWFSAELACAVSNWLQQIVEFADGFACISRSVAQELEDWLECNSPQRRTPIGIGYFHLGADIESSRPSTGLSVEDVDVLRAISKQESLLMVGTIEPRKGHAQVLSAMEQLWRQGYELQLVLVGKPGWLVNPLMGQLRNHSEKKRRLFWLEQVSDEALLKLYESASALLMASEGEGYGLPLIEAAQHGLPIIARDLPVFREVAGEHAFYFDGMSAEVLAAKLEEWLVCYKQGVCPSSAGIQRLTWRESANQLEKFVVEDAYCTVWRPRNAVNFTTSQFANAGVSAV